MAKKPNFGFEKRQKELAKKAKQEEKRLRKLEQRENPNIPAEDDTESETEETE